MKRSELVITVVGLIATFCLPWPGTEEPTAGAPHAPKSMGYVEKNSIESEDWVHAVVVWVGPPPASLFHPTR